MHHLPKKIILKITSLLSDSIYLRIRYFQKLHRRLNIREPKLFTEKLQWLKLNERSHLHTICADKVKAKEYVSEIIGQEHVIPILFCSSNVDDFIKESIPKFPFILKTNHDSGSYMIFENCPSIDYDNIRRYLKKKLEENYYLIGREWEYKDIEPMYFIEPLLRDSFGGRVLNDYKIHCFNGSPQYIQTIFDRNEDVKENWFDIHWDPVDVYYFSSKKKVISKPVFLKKMLSLAELLCQPFRYVRIDFYEVNGSLYFGEFTFRPYGGLMRWNPPEFDRKLGDMLSIK